MKTVLLLSGPNLSLTGQRQPELYGTTTLEEIVDRAKKTASEHGWELEHVGSESEGPLIEAVHAARGRCDAIVINAGALTHYAWALADALATFGGVVVEVHVSQPAGRESWRHTSVISPVADASISGLGALGYELALLAVARMSS